MGIDPSLTSTGLVVVDADGRVLHHEAVTPGRDLPLLARFQTHVLRVRVLRDRYRPRLVVMEAPAYSRNGRNHTELVQLSGVIRWELRDSTPPATDTIKLVNPMRLKKWAAGKGNVKKDQMRLAVYKRWGVDFESTDETDAFALAMMGLAHLRGEVDMDAPPPKRKAKTQKGGRKS